VSFDTLLIPELPGGTEAFIVQRVPGGKANILGGHRIGYSKQKKIVYVHVSYFELFPR
jgi:hypothetical protein